MKRQALILVALLSLPLAGCASKAADESKADPDNPDTWVWINPMRMAGVKHDTLVSPSMNREIGFNVMLPPDYAANPDRRYPVVYYLHGKGGTEASLGLMKQMMEVYRAEDLNDVIWVFPNGGQFSGYRDKVPGKMMSETWILREFIPYIDENYRTLAQGASRGLLGWSMGGGAALLWSTSLPDMFCCVATWSAAFRHARKELSENLVLNADQLRRDSAFWLAVGDKEGLYKFNDQFSKQLELLSQDYQYQVLPGVGHDFASIRNAYYRDVIMFFDQHLQHSQHPQDGQLEAMSRLPGTAP